MSSMAANGRQARGSNAMEASGPDVSDADASRAWGSGMASAWAGAAALASDGGDSRALAAGGAVTFTGNSAGCRSVERPVRLTLKSVELEGAALEVAVVRAPPSRST